MNKLVSMRGKLSVRRRDDDGDDEDLDQESTSILRPRTKEFPSDCEVHVQKGAIMFSPSVAHPFYLSCIFP